MGRGRRIAGVVERGRIVGSTRIVRRRPGVPRAPARDGGGAEGEEDASPYAHRLDETGTTGGPSTAKSTVLFAFDEHEDQHARSRRRRTVRRTTNAHGATPRIPPKRAHPREDLPASPLRAAATPLVERKSLVGFRAASEQTWGAAGLQAVCNGLPAEVRERTAGLRPLPKWNDVADLIAWHHAVWNGPAARDEKAMIRHIHATVEHGFGRVKRFLLSISTP
jgi:hypothetical protein